MMIDWHLVLEGLSWLYAISNMALALFAFNMFFLLALAIWHWREAVSPRELPAPAEWPTVLVQLPILTSAMWWSG